jgi:hypothetical protein
MLLSRTFKFLADFSLPVRNKQNRSVAQGSPVFRRHWPFFRFAVEPWTAAQELAGWLARAEGGNPGGVAQVFGYPGAFVK